MSDDESENDESSEESEHDPILGAQVAANSKNVEAEEGEVEVLSESDDE